MYTVHRAGEKQIPFSGVRRSSEGLELNDDAGRCSARINVVGLWRRPMVTVERFGLTAPPGAVRSEKR
jgi:hypothetical protein